MSSSPGAQEGGSASVSDTANLMAEDKETTSESFWLKTALVLLAQNALAEVSRVNSVVINETGF